jgi:uncharacterized membrane protein YdcZ (DUF606 family)
VYLVYASNLAAQLLFLHNLRPNPVGSQKAAATGLLLLTPAIGYALAATWPDALDVALSALVLGAMAGTAWISRFPRYRVGMGALLLVISQLLSIAVAAPTGQGSLPATAIWPLYYLGHLLICIGVIQTLRRDHQA